MLNLWVCCDIYESVTVEPTVSLGAELDVHKN